MKDADITSALGVGQSDGRANTQALCGGGGRVCAESQKAHCVGVKRDWTAKVKRG